MASTANDSSSWLGLLLSDATLRVCAVFTLVLVLMPPEGFGIELCSCKRLTNAPCPGCGMTRSGSNLLRGHWQRAVQYHPFGAVIVPLCTGLGLLGVAPRRWRERVRAAVLPRSSAWRPLWWIGLASFVLYGVGRWLLVYCGLSEFPSTWP